MEHQAKEGDANHDHNPYVQKTESDTKRLLDNLEGFEVAVVLELTI